MGNSKGTAAALQTFEAAYPPNPRLMDRMHRMFYPKTVAVVGASHNPMKWGHRVIHSILSAGFQGRVVPVNPKGGKILSLEVAKSLADVRPVPDLVLVAVPAERVMPVLEECVRLDVGSIFMITAGFSEADRAQLATERVMHELVSKAGIPLGGPNGQGLTCTQADLCAQMYPIVPPRGTISLVTQSGNVGVSMAHMALYHGIGLSKTISAGNEASLTTPDYVDYLAEDPDTTVITLYHEGADDGRRLLASIRRAARRKPVIVLKSGRTKFGARAAVSHTGSLAGEDRIYDAALRQAGAIRVYDLEELFDTAAAFATMPLPRGRRLVIVTMGGGWGVLASDAAADHDLELAPLPDAVKANLDAMLPPRWSKGNPIDFVAAEGPDTLIRTVDLLLESKSYDAMAILGVGHSTLAAHMVATSRLGANPDVLAGVEFLKAEDVQKAEQLLERIDRSPIPVVLASDAALSARMIDSKALARFREHPYPVYTSPERALRALGHMLRYSRWLERVGRN